MSFDRGTSVTEWDSKRKWILQKVIDFFNTEYSQEFSISSLSLSKSPGTNSNDILYAVLELKGVIRSTLHPEAAFLVLQAAFFGGGLEIILEDVRRSTVSRRSYRFSDADTRSNWLHDILREFFDPGPKGVAKLAKYDAELPDKTRRVLHNQAINDVRAIMHVHMLACWKSVLSDIQGIPNVDYVDDSQLEKEMQRAVSNAVNSIPRNAMRDIVPREVEIDDTHSSYNGHGVRPRANSSFYDIMRRCENLCL